MPHRFQTRPLYLQVRDAMLEKVRSREWPLGSQLPNEQQLAQEMGVSHGTVRKALAVLEREHLVRREQGRGTFVTSFDSNEIAFKFYAIKSFDGYPTSGNAEVVVADASELEQQRLNLHPSHKVVRVKRLRYMNEVPFLFEEITVPQRLFPDFASDGDVPGFLLLYYFEQSGIIAKSGNERVRAIVADDEISSVLSVPKGVPLVALERVMFDSDGRPFELRRRIVNLGDGWYEAALK